MSESKPGWLAPMSAVSGDLPEDDTAWAYEPKWDGMRAIVRIDRGEVEARSRTDKDIRPAFPELAALAEACPRALLDGEIVVVDGEGRSSFGRLQHRFGLSGARAEAAAAATPACLVVFDLLRVDDLDVWTLPFRQRREALTRLIPSSEHWQLSPCHEGDGSRWLEEARTQGLEGIMAKRLDARYQPGRRSTDWRKIKLRHAQEFLVCGWTPGTGHRSGTFGALVLGCHEGGALRWVGNVGTGFREADLAWWQDELRASERPDPPFTDPPRDLRLRTARWVHPRQVVQVAYGEWTGDGRLRHPAFLGRRPDVDPAQVRCEE